MTMANKKRILYLLRFLQGTSDDEYPVSTVEIRAALNEKSCPVTIEALRDDIVALKDAGYDIVVNEANGLPATYSNIDHVLDIPELQILIDAVSSSQFISHTRSNQLIAKLVAMAGPSHRKELKPGIMLSEFIKPPIHSFCTPCRRSISRFNPMVSTRITNKDRE